MEIRPATKNDYKEVIALYGEFVEDTARYAKSGNDSYEAFLIDPDSHLDAATDNDKIIGFVSYSARTVVRYPKPIVEVEELYVQPEYRRQGVGKTLMNRVVEFAKKNGLHYVFLASSKEREAAHHFYKSADFDEYALHFRKKP